MSEVSAPETSKYSTNTANEPNEQTNERGGTMYVNGIHLRLARLLAARAVVVPDFCMQLMNCNILVAISAFNWILKIYMLLFKFGTNQH